MSSKNSETSSTVNISARRSRHNRLIHENPSILKKKIIKKITHITTIFSIESLKTLFKKQSEHVSFLRNHFSHNDAECADLPCQRKFVKKVAYVLLLFFLLSSVDFYHFEFNDAYASSDVGIFSDFSLVADDEGYLSKSMPTGNRNYANREGLITHKVESGETVSGIAYMYGLRTATILDNNPTLGAGNFLKMGQELAILPVDGYLYTVKSGDNLGKIAKAFSIEEEKIVANNAVAAENLEAGAELVLAGVRSPEATRYIAMSRNDSFRSGAILGSETVSQTVNNVGFISPTPVNARYSRGFTYGHVGLDISRKDKSWSPNVVAPISGVVTKVRQTGYNGGYGTHLMIKRDDGIEVLMAHFTENKIYVREGEQVVAGQIVGLMGTTGRSSGVHLHIEVIQDGVKRNPLNYFSI
ncbi:MAG: peptidoglycan DD-metalloendopeptidase family protein [Candidatus Peregrinibacteria bacterium]|nr:peptidoglycan DD-metalloendopeptidase family protein [Candidatus Peregrinibacteria bacterium]MDZ4245394.1 peptidoglycan DD-metalloendopeptidase family protein [Candidatus Gracilibacteria bacterium]